MEVSFRHQCLGYAMNVALFFFCCYVLFLYVLFSCLPTPRPLGGGNQNRLPACTIFSLWLYILFLPSMLLWRYIFRQAGAQLRAGGGAWASFFFFLFGSGCGLWIGDYGFWIWETPKMEFFLLTFFFGIGGRLCYFLHKLFFLILDC